MHPEQLVAPRAINCILAAPHVPGEPVAGSSVQEGGLDLRLTLHKIGDTSEPLTDDHNPRSQEGLFRGRASGAFEPTVLLMP